jgi:hypothetical protein
MLSESFATTCRVDSLTSILTVYPLYYRAADQIDR